MKKSQIISENKKKNRIEVQRRKTKKNKNKKVKILLVKAKIKNIKKIQSQKISTKIAKEPQKIVIKRTNQKNTKIKEIVIDLEKKIEKMIDQGIMIEIDKMIDQGMMIGTEITTAQGMTDM